MTRRLIAAGALICIALAASPAFAFKLWATTANTSDQYFGAKDMPTVQTTVGKTITIIWSAQATSGNYSFVMGSSICPPASGTNPLPTGSYGGGTVYTQIDATQILTAANGGNPIGPPPYTEYDGVYQIYVLLSSSTGVDAGGTSQCQDNISDSMITITIKTTPPGIPTITNVAPGDSNLKVTMAWNTSSTSTDKGGFIVYYLIDDGQDGGSAAGDAGYDGGTPDSGADSGVDAGYDGGGGTDASGDDSGTDDASAGLMQVGAIYPSQWYVTSETTSTRIQINGLSNGTPYLMAAAQVDKCGNIGAPSAIASGTPMVVFDYYQYYKSTGGPENGGFCFIATAAYGSPLHPFVGTLREFRDRWLGASAPGRAFIEAYYRFSPYAADVIAESPVLRFITGTALLPVVGFAWLFLHPAAAVVALGALISFIALARRRPGGGRGIRFLLMLVAAGAVLSLAPGSASAESPRNFQLEIKFGPYWPSSIDNGNPSKPYQTIFGSGPNLMSQLELDYILWDKVGTISLGVGFGFWQNWGKGVIVMAGGEMPSSDTTVINLIPLQFDFIYRFDWLARKKDIPLMPYVKLGIDSYIWWVTNGTGSVAGWPLSNGKGYGAKYGWHVAGGLGFLLDFIDKETANDFDQSVGVNNTYLIFEWIYSQVNNFNAKGFNFSSSTFLAGILFEF